MLVAWKSYREESKMPKYNVHFQYGQTIVEAEDEDAVEYFIERRWGQSAFPLRIKPATRADIAYVTAMGGMIHKTGEQS